MSIIENISAEQAKQSAQAVRLQFVDAREVIVDANVRKNTKISKAFVASIKQYGVIVPVLAHPADDGRVTIEDGQRRILAAIDAERYEVPAYVVPENDTEALRIVRQLIANEHRAELDEAERLAAWKQLELDGMSATAIAKAVGEKPQRIKAGLAVAANEAATKEVARYEVTFDQALVIAEFQDDLKAVKHLRDTALRNPSQFDHAAQRLRDEREEAQAAADLIATYTERGYKQIDWPSYDDKNTLPFDALTTKDGEAITEDNYLGGNGYRFAVRRTWRGVEFGHFVTDWRKWGLKKRKADGTANTPWTEEQKAERRTLIANNKAWASAEKVRRAWLATFLSRKTTPKDALAFVAATVIGNQGLFSKQVTERHPLAIELLGLPERQWGAPHPLAAVIEQNPTRTTATLLAVAVAAREAATDKSTWRAPDSEDVAYFTALKTWGYALSDVENIVLGITPEPEPAEGESEEEPEVIEPEETADLSDAEPVEEESHEDDETTDADADEPEDGGDAESDDPDAHLTAA